MTDESTGVSAEVGVRKRGPDGEVQQEEGFLVQSGASRRGWYILFMLLVLSAFGVWQIIELILSAAG